MKTVDTVEPTAAGAPAPAQVEPLDLDHLVEAVRQLTLLELFEGDDGVRIFH